MLHRVGLLTIRHHLPCAPKRLASQPAQVQKDDSQTKSPAAPLPSKNPMESVGVRHVPSNFEKRLLAITGFYKNSTDVPNEIPRAQMEKCRNILRVRGTFLLMALGSIGAFTASMLGRNAAHQATVEIHNERSS